MQPRALIVVFTVITLAVPVFAADTPPSPHAGEQARPIKPLSDDDITALRKGEGIGMAKAAELNGYPGPAHVLTLPQQLGLPKASTSR